MIQELAEIKKIRTRLGLNQKELAEKAEVSQSLIAKIEAGKLEPTYSKARKIFAVLSSLEEKEEINASQLMNKKVVFAKPQDKIKEIVALMKKRGISQTPILKKGKVCGMVSEKAILDKMAEGKEVSQMTAGEIMDDCPPIISLDTSRKLILELLKNYSIVLVAEKGEIKGIISKSDLLEKIG